MMIEYISQPYGTNLHTGAVSWDPTHTLQEMRSSPETQSCEAEAARTEFQARRLHHAKI